MDRVWASKTSLTDTATRDPKAESVNTVRRSDTANKEGCLIGTPKSPIEIIVIMDDIIKPKMEPPNTLLKRILFNEIGASSNRSSAPILFSKVMTIASMDVVPKRAAIATSPGAKSDRPEGFRNVKAKAKTRGNSIPQLILGGLK